MPMAAVESADHIVCYVNPAFCLLVGKTRKDLIGNAFFVAAPAGGECLSLLDRVYQTGKSEIHTGQERPVSHPFYWSYVMWPILGAEGRTVAIMIQVTETTSFLLQTTGVNEALIIGSVHQHELTEQAELMNVDLQRANEDLKQFAYAASHDFQEPLRMITSYAQLLVEGNGGRLDGEAAICVDFIIKGAKHMRDLLADLLSYTEAGADSREVECIDLNTTFEKAKQHLQQAIDESGAIVTSGDLPSVDGQDARFVQLFQNLIGNGIKYRGKLPPRVHVSADQRNGEWCLGVADNGIGIESDYYQMIFGVFKRLHGRAIPGTGIGLAICQRVVERCGGRIWVESQVGHGTTFYFTLPMSPGKR
jgi:light-regulated signal transduction histidine kinase (bacteriophytochrome)